MEAENADNKLASTQSFSTHLLNLPPPPRYETAGGLSTRMIIDSASYTTTPCSSPPSEPSHVLSAYDTHRRVPDAAVLAEAGHVLERQMHQNELGHYVPSSAAQMEPPAIQISYNQEQLPNDRGRYRQDIIPPYMLHVIANSEAAGSQAQASAEQTLLSSKSTKHNPASEDFVPTAPAQRQLKDGRWTVVF